MIKKLLILVIIAAFISSGCTTSKPIDKKPVNNDKQAFTKTFLVDKKNLESSGRNPYFILEPGYKLKLSGIEDGKQATAVIEVTNQTKIVDGVETRVVKETHAFEGKTDEIALDYFAIDKTNNTVFYFGEDVDDIENGKVTGHKGTWHSGEKGAKFGVIMPGISLIGQRYYQEIAPKIALDKAETINVDEEVKLPAGSFKNCLQTEETTELEPGLKETKKYAPGVGQVQDGTLKLEKYGFNIK